MKEERFFYVPDAGSADELPASEAVHALRVLRLHEGDEMFLMDGKGAFYRAEVTLATSRLCIWSHVGVTLTTMSSISIQLIVTDGGIPARSAI